MPAADTDARMMGMHRIENAAGSVQVAFAEDQAVAPQRRLLAEGDSWFDKFTPLPVGGNLLSELRSPYVVALHDISHIGDEARDMVEGRQRRQTQALLSFPDFTFDAILLSAGGNDLKNVFAMLAAQVAAGARAVGDLLDPSGYQGVLAPTLDAIRAFVALRDQAGNPKNRHCPIVLHGYDYLQPRPAGAHLFELTDLGAGPWLWPILHQAGLSSAQMLIAARAVIDQFNEGLKALAAAGPNVHHVDLRGTLTPAPVDTTGPSAHWQDEIHPTNQGFALLARRWEATLLPLLQR